MTEPCDDPDIVRLEYAPHNVGVRLEDGQFRPTGHTELLDSEWEEDGAYWCRNCNTYLGAEGTAKAHVEGPLPHAKFNEPISEKATEHIEPGQVYATAALDPAYRGRTSIVEVVEGPVPDHPDAVVKTLESWDESHVGNETSTSPETFVARLYHRE